LLRPDSPPKMVDTINVKSIIKYGKSKRELIKKYRIYEIV